MKPRQSAPFTFEDWDIWFRGTNLLDLRRSTLIDMCVVQDRIDADLMLRLATIRKHGKCYVRFGRQNLEVPAVHAYMRMSDIWPAVIE